MNIGQYNKFIPPLLIALIAAAITAFQGTINEAPIVVGLSIGLAILNAYLTYRLPNEGTGFAKASKAWVNVAHVAVQAVLAIVATGIGLEAVTAEQWSVFALAVIGALSTYVFPNESARGVVTVRQNISNPTI